MTTAAPPLPASTYDLLESVFDQAALGLLVLDDRRRVVLWNHWMVEASGRPRDAVHGCRLDEIFPNALSPRLTAVIDEALDRGLSGMLSAKFNQAPLPLMARDGHRQVPMQAMTVIVRPIRCAETNSGCCLIQVRDDSLTARREAHLHDQARRASESEQRALLATRAMESAFEGIVIVDARAPDMPIQYVNPAYETLTGYSAAEVIGRNGRFLHQGDGDQAELARLRGALRDGHDVTVVLRNYRKTGELFWNELQVAPVRDSDGAITHFVGAQRDITRRKLAEEQLREARDELEARVIERTRELSATNARLRAEVAERAEAEAALRESEARFRGLADKIPGMVFQWYRHEDGRWGFSYVSPHCQSMFGVSANAISADPKRLPIHPDDAGLFLDSLRDTIDGGQDWRFEGRVLAADGSIRWVHGAAATAREGDRLIANGVLLDITQQKQAEAALALANAHIRGILGSMVDAVVTIDTAGVIDSINPAAERMFGYPAKALIGRNVSMLMPDSFARHHDAYLTRYLETGRARIIGRGRKEQGRRRDGSVFPIELGVAELTVPQPDGRLRHLFVGTIRDITEQEAVERTLRQAKEAAEQASRAKNEMIANMSHELRTPLNAILGFSDLIRRQQLGDDITPYAGFSEEIYNAGQHLLDIINDILDMAKIEAGGYQLAEAPVGLSAVVRPCLVMIGGRADAQKVTLTTELPEPDPVLLIDARAIKQILLNLLANAVKFNRPGGNVVVSAARTVAGGLDLMVRDTGIGMPPQDLERVMEPFQQGDMSTRREYGGTGLGLSIARTFADLHGARLSLSSVPGEGTVARLEIPPERVIAPPDQPRPAADRPEPADG